MSPDPARPGVGRRVILAGLAAAAIGIGTGSLYLLGRRSGALKTRVIDPVSQASTGGILRYDFGKVWFGNVTLNPRLPVGTRLILRLGEKLSEDGRIDRTPPGTVRYHETEVTVSGHPIRPPLTAADLRGMEDYGRAVMPFRYVEIENTGQKLEPFPLSLEASVDKSYTRTGKINFSGAGDISVQLNRLMELGLHTMEATSFMGIFVDGDRERLAYEADCFINQLGWYVATADPTVPRRTLKALLAKPTWPSEWMVHMIFIAWADYRMTGDKDYLASIINRLEIFSLAQFIDDSGLVTTSTEALNKDFVKSVGADYLEDIVDWPRAERDGYEMVPYNTVVNAFVFEGQRRLAELYAALGRDRQAEECRKTADGLRRAIIDKLIDPQDGVFVDGLGSSHKSAHASFIPLSFGLTPPDRIPQAISHIASRIKANENGFPCSVYAAQYLLDGLFEAGEGELALQLMLNPGRRGWLNMLDAHNATVTHEAWDLAFKENIDWTHAWGAAFLNVLQRRVLGVRALQPGWHEWTLQPSLPETLSIDAAVPTPMGLIRIKLDGDARRYFIDSPAGAKFIEPADGFGSWQLASLNYHS
ncbi:family 78 glycoside hydrolase catalytic domain [Rhizobium helianthi]|uniref:alpha-L-rhamnosidase n=1 Tax=Rhizobium helianthi TaxID=1132695 RepID=A0ABW4MAI8_9HYPH